MYEVKAEQPYMVARMLNSGLIVVEPQQKETAASSLFSLLTRGLLRSEQSAARQRLLYPEYDQESEISAQNVICTGEGRLKFCNITRLLPGQNFRGTPEQRRHSEAVVVRSRFPVQGFRPEDLLRAYLRFRGNGRDRSEVFIEELEPIK